MNCLQQEIEAKADKPEGVRPSAELFELSPQPRHSQTTSIPPLAVVKRKRAKSSEAETEADELKDMHQSKQSRVLFPVVHGHMEEDALGTQVHKLDWSGKLEPYEPTERADVGLSESRSDPKMYTGCSIISACIDDVSVWAQFVDLLRTSPRVLCVVGAGLSAPSGLDTWRGTNGLWNDIKLRELASPKKFQEDPCTVWNFYGERLLKSLVVQPNAAHRALAALASWHSEWLTINQNVDGMDTDIDNNERCADIYVGLLERTNYPAPSLVNIHGTLNNI
jgi:hypothetical protein